MEKKIQILKKISYAAFVPFCLLNTGVDACKVPGKKTGGDTWPRGGVIKPASWQQLSETYGIVYGEWRERAESREKLRATLAA